VFGGVDQMGGLSACILATCVCLCVFLQVCTLALVAFFRRLTNALPASPDTCKCTPNFRLHKPAAAMVLAMMLYALTGDDGGTSSAGGVMSRGQFEGGESENAAEH
jgi:hypothetical protein